MTQTENTLTRPTRKSYTDVETGEVRILETDEPVKMRRRNADPVDEEFVMVFPAALRRYKDALPGQRMTLLMMLLEAMDPRTGHSAFSATAIAAQLGTPDTYVSKMVREMIDAGLLTRIRRGVVAINPAVGWRGSLSRRRTLLLEQKLGAR